MNFKTSILWSGRLYKFLEKIGLEKNFNLDSFVDNNLPEVLSNIQTYSKYEKIAICQTNGKRTTTNLINQILSANEKTYISNVTEEAKKYPPLTAIILDIARGLDVYSSGYEKDYYVMALDEFEIANYFTTMKFDYLLLGNLFIDQKDFATLEEKKEKIKSAIALNSKLNLIINADDPTFYEIDEIKNDVMRTKRNKFYYGFDNVEFCDDDNVLSQKNDITKCPNCTCKLDYEKIYYSHIGKYNCECGYKRPKLDLSADAKIFNDYCFLTVYYKDNKLVFKLPLGGIYNAYNALGAIALAINLGIPRKVITEAFEKYTPLKARDDVFIHKGKRIKIKTIKNPTSLSSCVRELYGNKTTKVVFCLNDSIQDGIDTSWIWDSNFRALNGFENKIYIASNRFDDMALRLKYAQVNPSLLIMDNSIKSAIHCCYWELEKNESMLILTTPSLIDDVYYNFKK